MNGEKFRTADAIIAIYLLLTIADSFVTLWFVTAAMARVGSRTAAGAVFGPVFAAYIGASVSLAAWLYRDVLRNQGGRDSVLWVVGFVMFGGITIPIYYFLRRKQLCAKALKTDRIEAIARAVVAALLFVACVRMGWVLAVALGRVSISSLYRLVAIADRTLMWAAWVATVVVLIRRRWSVPKKLGWGAASLIGMFLIMPVLHFSYPQNLQPPQPNST